MEFRHLRKSQYRPMPWKNGQGTTTEFAIWPEGADFKSGGFEWRISTAPITADCEFSIYPGYERALWLWEGSRLELRHGAVSGRLLSGQVFRFPGEEKVTASVPEGPVRDVSLIYQREHWDAHVDLLRLGGEQKPLKLRFDFHLIVCAAGLARVQTPDRLIELGAEDTLLVSGATELSAREARLSGAPEAQVFSISLRRRKVRA
ncbi:MAG: HutD/Ves family protein [Bdellovibrionota bacterium]